MKSEKMYAKYQEKFFLFHTTVIILGIHFTSFVFVGVLVNFFLTLRANEILVIQHVSYSYIQENIYTVYQSFDVIQQKRPVTFSCARISTPSRLYRCFDVDYRLSSSPIPKTKYICLNRCEVSNFENFHLPTSLLGRLSKRRMFYGIRDKKVLFFFFAPWTSNKIVFALLLVILNFTPNRNSDLYSIREVSASFGDCYKNWFHTECIVFSTYFLHDSIPINCACDKTRFFFTLSFIFETFAINFTRFDFI